MGTFREFSKGLFRENPVFVLVLGMCPTLAVTTSVVDGAAMALAATVVLVSSNIIVSLVRNIIPKEVRIPCYIVIIASFVTMVELGMKAYLPVEISKRLGIFVPLIVVNCIILGRAEAFAGKRGPLASATDGLGMGAGFFLALVLISAIREILGNGTFAGYKVSAAYVPNATLLMAPGAFLVMGLLLGLFNFLGQRRKERQ